MPRHRAHTVETRPYSGCIAHRCVPESHGGECLIEHCKCGAWRARNVRGEHEERGLWEVPVQRGPGRPRLDNASLFVRMSREIYLLICEAARAAGMAPSTWARGVLEREAKAENDR